METRGPDLAAPVLAGVGLQGDCHLGHHASLGDHPAVDHIALGGRVRSGHSPGAAKNRKWPVAEVGFSAVSSPVLSSSRS